MSAIIARLDCVVIWVSPGWTSFVMMTTLLRTYSEICQLSKFTVKARERNQFISIDNFRFQSNPVLINLFCHANLTRGPWAGPEKGKPFSNLAEPLGPGWGVIFKLDCFARYGAENPFEVLSERRRIDTVGTDPSGWRMGTINGVIEEGLRWIGAFEKKYISRTSVRAHGSRECVCTKITL